MFQETDPALLPDLLHGAVGVEADDTGWRIDRMTPELTAFYRSNDAWALRAACPAGVRLAFRTDSPLLAMQLAIGGAARPIYRLEVAAAGEVLTFDSADGRTLAFSTELPGSGERDVEIHLPHLCDVRLQHLALAGGASIAPVRRPGGSILFLGDSITQGMTCSGPTRSWTALTAAALGRDFVNLGVGGTAMDARLGRLCKKYEWSVAFVAFGTNDCAQNVPPEKFRDQTLRLLRELRRRSRAEIYAITPIGWPAEPGPNALGFRLADYRKWLAECAGEVPGVRRLDGEALLPAEPHRFFDGLHPNDEGMAYYAGSLIRAIGGAR